MRHAVVTLLLLTACGRADRGLGDDPLDDARLADVPVLAPLADALDDQDATVLDLFEEDLAFVAAPDPTVPHRAEFDRQQALTPVTGERPLRVLTYNTGLLSRRYLGSRVEVPHIEERRAVMAEELIGSGADVLLLQEIWEWEDVESVGSAMEDAGFVWYAGTERTHQETGVMIVVRADLVDDAVAQVQEEGQYDAQRKIENWPGPNLKRGWIHWELGLAGTDAVLDLWCTHLTPFYDRWLTRELQARQLGLMVRDVPEDHLVIVGGDLNAGAYYASDTWVTAEGEEAVGWWENAAMMPLLRYYADVEDAFVGAVGPLDKEAGDAVPLDAGEAMLEAPFGDDAVCDGPGERVFTATDCNSIYFDSYAGTEFPVRMDALLFRGGDRMRVDGGALAFSQPVDGEEFELSDHYGVSVAFAIAP